MSSITDAKIFSREFRTKIATFSREFQTKTAIFSNEFKDKPQLFQGSFKRELKLLCRLRLLISLDKTLAEM